MSQSLALLLLRVGVGLQLAVLHGWGKIADFSTMKDTFPDPLGVGSVVSLCLVAFAEFACAVAVGLGLFTKLATVPIIVTMAVAAFGQHAGDPWKIRELALMYLILSLALILTGPGEYSIDHMLQKSKAKGKKS